MSYPCNNYNPCNPCGYPTNNCYDDCNCGRDHCKPKYYKKYSSKSCNKCYKRDCCCVEYYPCLRTKCGYITAKLEKSASPSYYTAAGQVITYTYTITNTGTAMICYPIKICDDKLGGCFLPCVNIYPGTSYSYNRTYTITNEDLTKTSITNTATAYILVKRRKHVCTNQATATITYGDADVSGTISQIQSDAGIDVTVTISNSASSATDAYNVNLILPFPSNVSGVTAGAAIPPASSPTINASNVTMTIAQLPKGSTYTYLFTYNADVVPGSYQWSGTITSSSFDPNLANNYVSDTITLVAP